MILQDFITYTSKHYKTLKEKNKACEVQISVKNGNSKSVLLPFCVSETLSKDIKNLVKGETYDRIVVEFKNNGASSTKIFTPEKVEAKSEDNQSHPTNAGNSFENIFGFGGMGSLGNPQSLGMAIQSEITRKVDDGRKEDKIKQQEEKIYTLNKALDKALKDIEDKDAEIEELEVENAKIQKMKQNLTIHGVDIAELGGVMLGKFFKNNPSLLTKGLGIPAEKLKDIFSEIGEETSSDTKTIENSPRTDSLKLISEHLKSLDEEEFNLTFSLIVQIQDDKQKKFQVYQYAKQLFEAKP